jgi:hypothetical protein
MEPCLANSHAIRTGLISLTTSHTGPEIQKNGYGSESEPSKQIVALVLVNMDVRANSFRLEKKSWIFRSQMGEGHSN